MEERNIIHPFEEYLFSIGYRRYRYVFKKPYNFEDANGRVSISTMGDISFKYFREPSIIKKIKNREYVSMKERIGNEIEIGLSEAGKPITLISPRPKIWLIRDKDNKKNYDDFELVTNMSDDAMNVCFQKYSHNQIYNSIMAQFKIDLTND